MINWILLAFRRLLEDRRIDDVTIAVGQYSKRSQTTPRVQRFYSYQILTSSVICYWADQPQHKIFLINFMASCVIKAIPGVTKTNMIYTYQQEWNTEAPVW